MAMRRGSSALRILAYHDVPNADLFESHLSYLASKFEVVAGPTLDTRSGRPPVWITFDDGDPSIIDHALGALRQRGMSATAFVCPGIIDTDEPFWWQVVTDAAKIGLKVGGRRVGEAEVNSLKTMCDEMRRSRVAEIGEQMVVGTGTTVRRRQLTVEELRAWIGSGCTLGNHSWDHPLLDRCTPDVQRDQIESAHDWFPDNGFERPNWFAYPNGNATEVARTHLAALGYEAALLFDHRLTPLNGRFDLSRIRVNGTDSLNEFISKVSGIHPVTARLRT
ncbi:MAG TPA: polysaccharide deacetylase family protein [Acidimicrobiia bacterium]|nr:polysaccharide deacetylase family protein [Acidimicrobiia bacterium]